MAETPEQIPEKTDSQSLGDESSPGESGGVAGAARPDMPWARATMWMVIVLIVVGGAVVVLRSCLRMPGETISRTGEAMRQAGETVRDVLSAFRRGTITTSFISYATTIEGMRYLQIGRLKQMEMFSRSDERTFGYIPLPEVVVEARAPIETTYYVDLNGKWQFVLTDNVIHVYAPEIQFNTPAVDVSRIQFEVKKGGFGSEQVRQDLQKSISFLSKEKARQNIPLIRETARREVGQFVEQWLMKNFSDATNYPVAVHFPNETGPVKVAPVME